MQAVKMEWGVQEIGEVAGQVWQCLKRNGRATVTWVEQQTLAPKQLTDMAIGWLAREGKLGLRQEGRSINVWLTE